MEKIPNLSTTSKTKEESCCHSDMTSLYPYVVTSAQAALGSLQNMQMLNVDCFRSISRNQLAVFV